MAAETHPDVRHHCPRLPFVLRLQPCPGFIALYYLTMASVVSASSGALFGLNPQHVFIYFVMAKLYIYVCVYMYIDAGFSSCCVNSSRHCQSGHMALKPCPSGVRNVLFTVSSIDLGYCNVRGVARQVRKQLMETGSSRVGLSPTTL